MGSNLSDEKRLPSMKKIQRLISTTVFKRRLALVCTVQLFSQKARFFRASASEFFCCDNLINV
jgi:hypothetical protein